MHLIAFTARAPRPTRRRLRVALALAATVAVLSAPVLPFQEPPAAPQPASIPIEVTAVDRDGKIADGLRPEHFAVSVDGKPRRVLWVRYVSRGPGATRDAVLRRASRTEVFSVAAEPSRNVLIVVDEPSIERGAERTVTQAAGALVDRLGLDDNIGVVRYPIARDIRVSLTTLRPEVREALGQVRGQAPSQAARVAELAAAPQSLPEVDPRAAAGEQGQAAGVERPPSDILPIAQPAPGGSAPSPDIAEGLQQLLASIASSPRRTVILLYSGGLPSASSRLEELSAAAAAAHAVIYGFGLPGDQQGLPGAPDLGALERLAVLTGGSYTRLGRSVDRSLERVVTALSACYVLGVESQPSDRTGGRHGLRVEAPRQPVSIQAPAFLVPTPAVEDVLPPPESAPGASAATAGGPLSPVRAPASAARARTGRRADASARDSEVQRLVAKAVDYVAGYEREYSLLVAEENYLQITRTERRQVGSDLLLVRRPAADGWVSFRDVFEVNGSPVRDREDRLKKLFLDASAEAEGQLKAIMEDSARYNIGQLERNINVPLFPLKFLYADNVSRFAFRLEGTDNVGGVEAARLAYEEIGRPTVVRLNRESDVPATGSFLIDPASGAILGTRFDLEWNAGRSLAEFVVQYERNGSLGLWVPSQMTEGFWAGSVGVIDRIRVLEARATYSKFRRFQVNTAEQVTLPK